eukprot:6153220-Pyramimonas_sp.AAC.1
MPVASPRVSSPPPFASPSGPATASPSRPYRRPALHPRYTRVTPALHPRHGFVYVCSAPPVVEPPG